MLSQQESPTLSGITGFPLSSNSDVLYVNCGGQLGGSSCTLVPPPVGITMLGKWCPASVEGAPSSDPAVHELLTEQRACISGIISCFYFCETMTMVPAKCSSLCPTNKNKDKKYKLQTRRKYLEYIKNSENSMVKHTHTHPIVQLENGRKTWRDISPKADEHRKRWSTPLVIREM